MKYSNASPIVLPGNPTLPSSGDGQDSSCSEIGVVIMQVADHNIGCVVLFIFKAHSHASLVDPKTTERGKEGRYYPQVKDEES